ncbi:MAG TPA: 50S ribosomal protein L25/general stress protein Ctc, partial [Terrisporobacter glycolicus]|nr:50S ribosomal protein L25/general stress protein Ctc [Terrisporobacter hibernicus]
GTVLTVGEIPELNSDKIELQIDPDSIVLRVSERISNATTAVEG